ncbi:Sec-independent protein translocase protein TatB [Lysobacter sp. N42]|jgi:sec-independent protein translocase protein TatB|uniref:Sec-independent protein translocase protein TatB n=1 Tax=Lysobacter sp. N42 TaxID=2545719 RepID=UPI00104FA813|nr:Sec-independent protein translocase protein TatB [Lysobacter sp. N42]TCZ81439.1 twin-arginine translocase subunit TatB [Lysobacter sp. N42]
MFDIGFSELLVIAVVALLVLGPERLPRAARFAGLWVRRARAQWYAVKSELETELADEEMRRSLHRAREELREAQAALARDGERLREQLRDVEAQITRPAGAPGDAGPARDVHDDDAAVAASFEHPPAEEPRPEADAPRLPDGRPRDVG